MKKYALAVISAVAFTLYPTPSVSGPVMEVVPVEPHVSVEPTVTPEEVSPELFLGFF